MRSETPAIVIEKDLANDIGAANQDGLVNALGFAAMFESTAIAVVPHFSPPGGKFILRI